MSEQQQITLAQNYWTVHDTINNLAQRMRPSRNGSTNAATFHKEVEAIPGYKEYAKGAHKFQEWIAEQRAAVTSRRPGVNPAHCSTFPDLTGREVPALDLARVEAYFRENLGEFGKILTA